MKTQTECIDEIMSIIESHEKGHTSALNAAIRLKNIEDLLKSGIEVIKSWREEKYETIQLESSDYPEGYEGYKFEFRSGGKSFKFDHIPAYAEKKAELKAIEEEHKQAWNSHQKGLLVASEDGEEMVMPEVQYRKSSLIIKPLR